MRQVGQLPRIIAWCTVNKTLYFVNIRPVGVELFYEDRRTDGLRKADRYPLKRGLDGPQSWYGCHVDEKDISPRRWSNVTPSLFFHPILYSLYQLSYPARCSPWNDPFRILSSTVFILNVKLRRMCPALERLHAVVVRGPSNEDWWHSTVNTNVLKKCISEISYQAVSRSWHLGH